MSTCPNRNLPEFQALVLAFNEVEAYRLWDEHGDDIANFNKGSLFEDAKEKYGERKAWKIAVEARQPRVKRWMGNNDLPSLAQYEEFATSIQKKIQQGTYVSDNMQKIIDDAANIEESDDKLTYVEGSNSYGRISDQVQGQLSKFIDREVEGTPAENKAFKLWDKQGLNPDTKQFTEEFPDTEMNKEEYIENLNNIWEKGRAKGTIIHKFIQIAFTTDPVKKAKLRAEIEQIASVAEIMDANYSYGWITKKNADGRYVVLEKIFKIAKINTLEHYNDKSFDEFRDIINPEVKIKSDITGFAGTIDTLVEHKNGESSIVDWKTGYSFNTKSFSNFLKYGDRGTRNIYENPRNKAKLQVMLYAFNMKVQHPDVKFRNLIVHWIPNEYEATHDDRHKMVDVENYLSMIEEYYKNEEPAKYEEILAASPNAFNPLHYSSTSSAVADEMTYKNKPYETIYEQLVIRQRTLVNEIAELKALNIEIPDKKKKELKNITAEIAELRKDPLIDRLEVGEDIGLTVRWFGQYADTNHPLLQTYKQAFDEAQYMIGKEKAMHNRRQEPLLKAAFNDFLKASGKKGISDATRGQLLNYEYTKFYKRFTRIKQTDNRKEIVFVTDEKGDAENEAAWNSLTANEQALLKFWLDEKDQMFHRAMNRVAMEKDGNKKTYLDIYKQSHANFKYDRSFFPKVPITKEEINKKFGVLSKERVTRFFDELQNEYLEDTYVTPDLNFGLPVRYLGSPNINAGQMYTMNIEIMMDKFMANMYEKEYMDDVYYMGQGVLTILESDANLKNSANFHRDKMMNDLLKQRVVTQWSRSGFNISVGGKKRKIDVDMVLRAMKKLTSASIMWLKPHKGIANGIFAFATTAKKALSGSISSTFLGIEGTNVDFTLKDEQFAWQEWLKYEKDAMMGNLKDNKLFMLAKELRFLPDDFGYTKERSGVT